MITPREMLRDYMTVLNILMQNKNATFENIISSAMIDNDSLTGEREDTANTEEKITKKVYKAEDIEF